MLKTIIFNVERGFCAFIRSPNGYALLIDCGRSAKFSPIKYILKNEIENVTEFEGKKLAMFICSHPHDDHISDIELLKEKLAPRIISGWRFDDWEEIKDPDKKGKGEYVNLDSYSSFRDEYTAEVQTYPDWGMKISQNLGLSISESKKVNDDRFASVNNSSRVISLEYKGYKIFFPGDLMKDGWKELLTRDNFKAAIKGTDFFVASHHGHKTGCTQEIFDAIGEGKPLINIVSEKSGDEVCSTYSDEEHANGIEYEDETRRMFSTRQGSIIITVSDKGEYEIKQQVFDDNLT